MENTGPLLFARTNLKYYLYHKGNVTGPHASQDIFEQIERHEASIADFIWRSGWSDFKRIMDESEFQALVTRPPESGVIKALQRSILEKTKSKKVEVAQPFFKENISYYLYHCKTQYGPFSEAELCRVLESGKVDDSAYVWIKGWKNWKKITELEEFASALAARRAAQSTEAACRAAQSTEKEKSDTRKNKRSSPRKPLVARLFVTDETDVIVAVCRDISLGGMQVLTDRIPGEVGTKVKLNISPADTKKFKSFIAEGQIVRHLEDGRGFSFRFTKISTDVKKAIQSYIEA